MKVNASSIRNGNTIELNGVLCVVLKTENLQPGKGAPVTQMQVRRVSDGVKISERFRTTEQIERCFIEEIPCTYLYKEGDFFIFMRNENFEQIYVLEDIIDEQAVYLQESMEVKISMYGEKAISAEIPARVDLEVIETEPVIKGQTATSSYKPAVLSNGVKIGVPGHIGVGAKITVDTRTNEFVSKA